MNKPRIRRGTAIGGVLAGVAGLLLPVFGPTGAAQAADTGIHVSNGRVYEADGSEFVMRGVNHAHAWYPDETGAVADISAKGANTVRVVLGSGDRWARTDTPKVASIISDCKASKVICVLEVHDTTGYGEDGAAASLDKAADYWIGVKSALLGQEDYVVVNIGNEPFGNSGYTAWTDATKNAIGKLRGAADLERAHGGRPQLGSGLVEHHAEQRRLRLRLRPPPQHHLLHPHVRRVRHGRRGAELPRSFREQPTPHRRR